MLQIFSYLDPKISTIEFLENFFCSILWNYYFQRHNFFFGIIVHWTMNMSEET